MIDPFLAEGFFPFTLALALLFGLLVLEGMALVLGATILGAGADGIDTPDLDAPDLDLEIDLEALNVDPNVFDLDSPSAAPSVSAPSVLNWFGLGAMPSMIWVASICLAFGLVGLTGQMIAVAVLGGPLSAALMAVPAACAAVLFARTFGALFARLLPKFETEALPETSFGRRRGIVTQGQASRGRPAEVRITDRFGNAHYLRAEPLSDSEVIPQGSDVLVLRHKYGRGYLLIPMS